MRLRKGTASAWVFVATTSAVVAVWIVIGVLRTASDCAGLRPRSVPSYDARHILAENAPLLPEQVVNSPRVAAAIYRQRDGHVVKIVNGDPWEGAERIVATSQVLLDKAPSDSPGWTTARPASVMCDPHLRVRKLSDSNSVNPGGRIVYTICLSNTGDAAATSVVVTDVLDAGVHFYGSLPEHTSGDGGVRVWEFPQLRAEGSLSIVITATASSAVTSGLLLTNVVYVRSQEVSVISSTRVVRVSAPTLSVDKTDSPDPVAPGGLLTYTIVYSNSGNADATGVCVQEFYDDLTCFERADPRPEPGHNDKWCYHGVLPPDGKNQIITVTVSVGGLVTPTDLLVNTAFLYSSERPPVSKTITTEVSAPVLWLDKTDWPDPVAPGGLLTYTIVYSNSGTADATGVCLRELYDDLTRVERADPPPEPGYNDKWCHNGRLSPDGKNHLITVTVRVSDSASLGTVLSNTVFLYSSEKPPVSKTITTSVGFHYLWLPLVQRNYCRPGPWWCSDNGQNLTEKTVFALAHCDNGTLFVGAEDGIYRRAPGDGQWQPEASTTGEVRGLAASSDCSAVYAAVLDQGILSRNGGSWTLVSPSEMTGARTVVLAGDKVLAGGDFGVEYSSVGPSHHWESCGARLDDKIVTNLVRSDGWVYVAVWGGGVRRFPEYDCRWPPGDPWDDLGKKSEKYVLQAIGSSIDGEPEFEGTHDGWYRWAGDEWERCGNVRTFCFAIDGTTVYAGQEVSGVLRSTDDGVTWKPMNNGWVPPLEVRALLVHVDGDGRRWLYSGTTEGVWRYSLN